jgi:hypothetical protein
MTRLALLLLLSLLALAACQKHEATEAVYLDAYGDVVMRAGQLIAFGDAIDISEPFVRCSDVLPVLPDGGKMNLTVPGECYNQVRVEYADGGACVCPTR